MEEPESPFVAQARRRLERALKRQAKFWSTERANALSSYSPTIGDDLRVLVFCASVVYGPAYLAFLYQPEELLESPAQELYVRMTHMLTLLDDEDSGKEDEEKALSAVLAAAMQTCGSTFTESIVRALGRAERFRYRVCKYCHTKLQTIVQVRRETHPFSAETLPPIGRESRKRLRKIRQHSRERFGRSREVIERSIERSLLG